MKKLLLFFVGVVVCTSLYSQTGDSCTTARVFDSTSTDGIIKQFQVQQNQWFKFTAINTKVDVTIFGFRGFFDEIKGVKFWSGTCGGLSLIGLDTVSGTTDSMMNISTTALTIGQVYYLQFFKNNGKDKSLFSVDLNFLLPVPTCATCGPTTTCDLVCNGNFEYSTGTPTTQDQLVLACPWLKANLETPDYFKGSSTIAGVANNWVGTQTDFIAGHAAYAGFIAYSPTYGFTYQENFYEKLKVPMAACETYKVKIKFSLSETSKYAVNSLGAYFCNFSIGYCYWK